MCLDPTQPRPLRYTDAMTIGVDLGGSKIEAALVDANGKIRASVRRPTLSAHGPQVVIAEIVACVREVRSAQPDERVLAVGVGAAGQVDPATGTVWFAPNLGWRDVPLREYLESALDTPVTVLNDVQAATYGEWVYGAGRGASDLVCLFVGTGVGGGVIVGGQLLRGCSGSAGEIGHTIVVIDGRPCHGGHAGCLEAYAGGWAITRRAEEAVAESPARGRSLLAAAGGTRAALTPSVIGEAARRGDALAADLVDEIAQALGAGAASIVNALNPCTLLLGGGVIEAVPELVDAVADAVHRLALPMAARTVHISRNGLLKHAGSIGAAAWVRDTLHAASGPPRRNVPALKGPTSRPASEHGRG